MLARFLLLLHNSSIPSINNCKCLVDLKSINLISEESFLWVETTMVIRYMRGSVMPAGVGDTSTLIMNIRYSQATQLNKEVAFMLLIIKPHNYHRSAIYITYSTQLLHLHPHSHVITNKLGKTTRGRLVATSRPAAPYQRRRCAGFLPGRTG